MSTENQDKDYGQFKMLRDLFHQMDSEIDDQKKKKPEGVVNKFKVDRINKILQPLSDLMKDEPYASYLELVPVPNEEKAGRNVVENGLSYSDVSLILSQYRGALHLFYQEYFSNIMEIG